MTNTPAFNSRNTTSLTRLLAALIAIGIALMAFPVPSGAHPGHGTGLEKQAFDELERAIGHVGRESALTLELARLELFGFIGKWRVCRHGSAGIAGRPGSPPEVQFSAHALRAIACAFVGPIQGSTKACIAARGLREQIDDVEPHHEHWLMLSEAYVDSVSGRVDRALQTCRSMSNASLRGEVHPDFAGWWLTAQAIVSTNAGFSNAQICDAVDLAVRLLRDRDLTGLYSLAVSAAAASHALVGHTNRATELLGHYDSDLRAHEIKTTVLADRAEAWLLNQAGDRVGAIRAALRGAENAAVENDALLFALPACYDAIRFGDADSLAPLLRELVAELDAPLGDVAERHRLALANRAADDLQEVAHELVSLGAPTIAADALDASALCTT